MVKKRVHILSRDDTYNHVVREAGVERNCGLNTVYVFRGQ
jgi:hypothetical protein